MAKSVPVPGLRAARHSHIALLLSLALLTATPGTASDVQFVEVGSERGIGPFTMAPGLGGGVVATDFDDDGDVDLFVPNARGVPDQLYRNLGNGHFEEIAVTAGVASVEHSRSALWFDYDGDHRLDLFVAGDCSAPSEATCPGSSTHRLYRQVADAQFEDVTVAAGVANDTVSSLSPQRSGICAGDVNGDGYLDLLVGLWFGQAQLFRNDGDGTFTDVSSSSGILFPEQAHWQAMMHDFDGDGRQDVYHALDFSPNRLLVNQGDETFVNQAAQAGADNSQNDMGLALGDYDNDGDLDIYITNILNASGYNVLYRNDSVGDQLHFVDVSFSAGVYDGGWGWGATFLDADNDGDLDLAATNGSTTQGYQYDASRFFLNLGGDPVTFADMSDASGFNDTLWGSSLNALDFDRDGDLDLVQACNGNGPQPHALRLLENQLGGISASNRYLVVKPRMPGPNQRAIGAVVRARIGTLELMRPITAGTSFLGQEPAEAFFGLGTAATVDEVIVEWPGGTASSHANVAADQVVTLVTPLELTLDGDVLSWFHPGAGPGVTYDVVRGDLPVLLATSGDFGQATEACLADDLAADAWTAPGTPAGGDGFWYLVRPVTAGGPGSYDDQSGWQTGSRNPGIDASGLACP